MQRSILCLILLSSSIMGSAIQRLDCPVAKEYVTLTKYLNSKSKLYNLTLQQKTLLAERAAGGCEGAAGRFINILELLTKANIDSRTGLKLAGQMALKSESEAKSFQVVFKASYARDLLDLDAYSATQKARSLSVDLTETPHWLAGDFLRLAKTCIKSDLLAIPKSACADFITKLLFHQAELEAQSGHIIKSGVAKPFLKGLSFLTEDRKGPKLANFQALSILQDLFNSSPYSADELRSLFIFLTNRDQNPLSRDQALSKAIDLAKKTRQPPQLEIPVDAKLGAKP